MTVPQELVRHLESWLGAWPPPAPGVTVVGAESRERPGWDGVIRPVRGVSTPEGTVIGVPRAHVAAVQAVGRDLEAVAAALPTILDLPDWRFFSGVFRWTVRPAPDTRRGVWLPTDDPRVLPWLQPFNGDVLVGFDGTEVAAGVGRKQHDRWGHELAVVTEEGHQGRGWATDLIAQAAHRVIADGAVPTYLHAPGNEPSARTADASGFPDRGWLVHGLGLR